MTVADGPCPACGKQLDADTPVSGGPEPDPGDVSICVGCGAVLQYLRDADDGLLHRHVMTAEAVERLPADIRATLEKAVRLLGAHGAGEGFA